MVDSRDDGLAYGHYGECIYDPYSQAWSWPRAVRDPVIWIPIGQPARLPLDHGKVPTTTVGPLSDHGNRDTALEIYLQRRPVTVPALGYISESIKYGPGSLLDSTQSCTSKIEGSRLLVTQLPLDNERVGHLVDTICFVEDEAPSTLTMLPCAPQKQGWGRDRHNYIRVPRPATRGIRWDAPSRILQLVASESIDSRRPLLAARTVQDVFILSPHTSAARSESRMQCEMLYTLPQQKSLQSHRVDVAFNPWYHWQVGIVEADGTWRIFELPHSHRDREVNPYQACFGTIQSAASGRARWSAPDDGWARILWAGNASSLVVCRRTSATLIDISGRIVTTSLPDLGLGRAGWILDARRSNSNTEHIYILTSTHLFQLYLRSTDPESLDTPGSSGSISITFKIPHFRDQLDVHLTITMFGDEDRTLLAVTSPNTAECTVFDMRDASSSAVQRTTLADTSVMSCPLGAVSLAIQALPWGGVGQAPLQDAKDSIARHFRTSQFSFWNQTILTRGGNVMQQTVCLVPPDRLDAVRSKLIGPHWRDRWHAETRLARDAFVVSDDLSDEDVLANHTALMRLDPSTHLTEQRRSSIDFQCLYTEVDRLHDEDREDWNDVLERIRNAVTDSSQPDDAPLQLLSEFAQHTIVVNSLEQEDNSIPDLISLLETASMAATDNQVHEQASTNPIDLIASPDHLKIGDWSDETYSLASIYDRMVNRWVSPLNDSIPGRTRLAKEQLARSIAAQVYLSSFRYLPAPKPTASSVPFSQISQSTEVPDLGHQSQASSRASSTERGPSSRASSTERGPSSRASSAERGPDMVQAALAHLRQYTTINPPTAPGSQTPSLLNPECVPPDPLPKSMARVLATWELGAKPDSHDWKAATNPSDSDSDTGSDHPASIRARLARKRQKARDQRRREREDTAASAQTAASSRAPTIALSQDVSRAASSQPVSGGASSMSSRATSSQPPGFDGGRFNAAARARARSLRGERVQTRSQTAATSSPAQSQQQQRQPQWGADSGGAFSTVGLSFGDPEQSQSQSHQDPGALVGRAVASQIEPGRHGGRLVVQLPRRKRRRVEGF